MTIKKCLLLIGVIVTTYSPFAFSAEYIIGASFSPTLLYDDNVELREPEESDFYTRVSPTLEFSRAQENSTISFDLGYRIERYASLSRLDREDPFANFSSSYLTERSTYGLTANYSQNAQRDIADEDTGVFGSNATVTSRSIAPSYQYQLSAKDFVYTNLAYSERTYSSSGSDISGFNNFSDNETISYSGGWNRNFTERLSGGVALTYVTYEAESDITQSEYDSYNISLTGSYALTEKWSVDGSFGYRTTDSENTFGNGLASSDTSSGTLFDFSVIYLGEVNRLTLAISRSLSPSGEGVVNEQDQIALNWNRDLSERLSFSLDTTYQESTSVDQFSSIDREYLTIAPSVNWQLREKLSLDFGYRYRRQSGTVFGNFSNSDDIDSNMLYLTINYNWDGIRFSR